MRMLAPLAALVLLATSGTGQAAPVTSNLPGRILFVKDGDLWLLDASGPRPLATGGTFSQPAWGPDGSTIAYVYRGNNFADVFVTDDQGQSQTRLTNSQSTVLDNNDWNLRPTFSPDGQTIAFVSDKTSALPTLSAMSAADGSGRHALPTPGLQEEDVDSMSWSPDGSQLAVTWYVDPGPSQIALVPLSTNGRQPGRLLTNLSGGALDPAWAPDGSWVAFAGRDGYAVDIYAVQPDGSASTRLTNDGLLERSPAWSPDGRHLAYLSNKTGYYEIFEIDLETDANGGLTASNPTQLTTDLRVDAASGLAWGK